MTTSNLLLKPLPTHTLSFLHPPLPKRLKKPLCSSSLSPTPPPPSSREDAILQAKTSLSISLQKPLTKPIIPLISTRKLKKPKQPRFRIEVPIVESSPSSISLLALHLFSDLPLLKKATKPTILLLWPDTNLLKSALEAFSSSSDPILNSMMDSIEPNRLNSADLAAFVSPDSSQLGAMRSIAEELYPKPLVLLNPKWGFEDEKDFTGGGGLQSFLRSFEVVYSFMGLEVKGLLSRRKVVVFRCGGEGWVVMVEEEGGEMKVVSRFKRRPEIGEVENVLYNLMAANSPVTKSVKFLRDLASTVTGKKVKQ